MATEPATGETKREVQELNYTTVRFAGDSGDGMQLMGTRFANASALLGEDVVTLAEYPAEIRAPAGSLAGVSGFQANVAGVDIFTPGDDVDVLVAMNPAALKTNVNKVRQDGIIIVNQDSFVERNFAKAEYKANPLESGELDGYKVFPIEITRLTKLSLKDLEVPRDQAEKSKNFFALGLICWLFHRPMASTEEWIRKKFANKQFVIDANIAALNAGYNYGESTQLFATSYIIKKPRKQKRPGTYRYVNGNGALSMGLITAANRAGLNLFLGSYPITPASDILHEMSRHKEFPVTTFQAEDEIAAIGAALGASFAGALGVTTTSGPGIALKSEFMNLGVITELPLIVVDVQRGGPSTGLPTKMEQADLLQVLWGRNGESPIVVMAPRSPKDCFWISMEAVQIAAEYMTPVVILSDGYIANGSEGWRIPDMSEIPQIKVNKRTDPKGFLPYIRDPETLARPWAEIGTAGLEHTLGGLEKNVDTGCVDQSPENHSKMVHLRAEKVARAARSFYNSKVYGAEKGDVLVVGWGSTYGALVTAVTELHESGKAVGGIHLRHLHPFQSDLAEIFSRFKKVLVVENNLGQAWIKLRAEIGGDIQKLNKVTGTPFKVSEVKGKVMELLGASK